MGQTGLVGTAAVQALLAEGHSVRLFARHAASEGARFKGQALETRDGSVASPLDVASVVVGEMPLRA